MPAKTGYNPLTQDLLGAALGFLLWRVARFGGVRILPMLLVSGFMPSRHLQHSGLLKFRLIALVILRGDFDDEAASGGVAFEAEREIQGDCRARRTGGDDRRVRQIERRRRSLQLLVSTCCKRLAELAVGVFGDAESLRRLVELQPQDRVGAIADAKLEPLQIVRSAEH